MTQDIAPWTPSLPQKYDDDTFNKVASASSFLPRLQLMISQSECCKSGEFPINHYALVQNKENVDLGKEVEVLLLAWRPKALEITDDAVLSVFDVNHQEFTRIRDKADISNSGCMFGPEFLLWIPGKGYATFFMASKSARFEAPHVKAYLKTEKNPDVSGFCILKSKLIEGKKNTWYCPTAGECQVPSDYPDIDETNQVIEKFMNPPQTDVEVAPEAASEVAR